MIRKPTVFILGAGASWHYGYPTGEDLVHRIAWWARQLLSYCEDAPRFNGNVSVPLYVKERCSDDDKETDQSSGWEKVGQDCRILLERLEVVRPLVIDHFLAWHSELRDIGRLLIACCILECDAAWQQWKVNLNHISKPREPLPARLTEENRELLAPKKDFWYRFIIHRLLLGLNDSEELLRARVNFVTFNYDTSLDYYLGEALSNNTIVNQKDVDEFLAGDRILHVYGSTRVQEPASKKPSVRSLSPANDQDLHVIRGLGAKLDPNSHNWQRTAGQRNDILDRYYNASRSIRTIDPYDKKLEDEQEKAVKELIEEAEVIYILGYSFDTDNCKRIGLDVMTKPKTGERLKHVMFTNFNNSNVISKRAGRLFSSRHDTFLKASSFGNGESGLQVEMSVRSTYDALCFDFADIETES